jgi:hypothetical protein
MLSRLFINGNFLVKEKFFFFLSRVDICCNRHKRYNSGSAYQFCKLALMYTTAQCDAKGNDLTSNDLASVVGLFP